MKIVTNPYRGRGLPQLDDAVDRAVSADHGSVLGLLAMCPIAAPTPLLAPEKLCAELGLKSLFVKDERSRMGLGSFKALGASFAIANAAFTKHGAALSDADLRKTALQGQVFVTASAGNHGISVAAGARVFGALAIIYLAKTVPNSFADRLRSFGAEVVFAGETYEQSMQAAQLAATARGATLLSDSTWSGYSGGVDVMQGYLALAEEIVQTMGDTHPTHIFLQAGVGGLAAGVSARFRAAWGDAPQIIVVEPNAAPALQASIQAGVATITDGPVSNMGRLDCKEPSLAALAFLARAADAFVTCSDTEVSAQIEDLDVHNLATSPSGGAGMAALRLACAQGEFGLDQTSCALVILSEGQPED